MSEIKKFLLICSVIAGITAVTVSNQMIKNNQQKEENAPRENTQNIEKGQQGTSDIPNTAQIPASNDAAATAQNPSPDGQAGTDNPKGTVPSGVIAAEDENLVLVNKWHSVSKSYVPEGLVGILDKNGKPTLPCSRTDLRMKKATFDAVTKMFADAKGVGITDLVITSAFRSYEAQKVYYDEQVRKNKLIYPEAEAIQKAGTVVAVPGTSEHQTGFALDVTVREYLTDSNQLRQSFADTKAGKWVGENCWKYGFVVRYKTEKSGLTGIINEPWHIRFVGTAHAEFMVKQNMCLEEYLKYLGGGV